MTDRYRCLKCGRVFDFPRPQQLNDPLPACTGCGHVYVRAINKTQENDQ